MKYKITIEYTDDPRAAPFITVYKDTERIFMYYYPEKEYKTRGELKKKGIPEWLIDRIINILKTVTLIE